MLKSRAIVQNVTGALNIIATVRDYKRNKVIDNDPPPRIQYHDTTRNITHSSKPDLLRKCKHLIVKIRTES